ncbi:MAG: undecaprenyldiphospho-muramoylpentapeptide beta-N-acetylglucosaminyltransferase [Verrucomicrobiota bacterium]
MIELMANICIACGGTGGHLFPGLSIAEELQRRGHTVRLYLSNKPIDAEVMKHYPQFETSRLPAMGWTGVNWKMFSFAWNFWRAYQQCLEEWETFAPRAVIGMGGFLSAPPLMAAMKKGIPAYMHESNSIPGKVTRWLASHLTKIFLGFHECSKYFSRAITRFTGTPVRASLKKMDRWESAKFFGLDAGLKVLTIVGGSQGAHGLNQLMLDSAQYLLDEWPRWQVIHLTGAADAERAQKVYSVLGVKAKVFPFCAEMEKVYSLTDLIVARAGAASLCEISYFGLPSVLVPFPAAAEDHQTCNAEIFARAGAAQIFKEKATLPQEFARGLRTLIRDDIARGKMAEAAKALFHSDAAQEIVEEVEHAFA